MMSEIASPAERVRFAAAPRRLIARKSEGEKEFSASLIIISSILANYRPDLTVEITSRKPRAMRKKKASPILLPAAVRVSRA